MSDSGPAKAKRGDLCIVHTHNRYTFKGDTPGASQTSESDRFKVGRVTNIFQDGRVKLYLEATVYDGEVHPNETPTLAPWTKSGRLIRGTMAVWVVPQAKIDVERAMHIAAHNTYRIVNEHLNTSSAHTRAFDSLGVLRAALGIPLVGGKLKPAGLRQPFAVGQLVRLAGDDLTGEEARETYRITTVCGIVPDCYELDLGSLGGDPHAMHCDAKGLVPAVAGD